MYTFLAKQKLETKNLMCEGWTRGDHVLQPKHNKNIEHNKSYSKEGVEDLSENQRSYCH
ncbi:10081_t:CDS:2 [Cetraspora pellucida]|uniref:10081_t:CDS:1 n=1 Tax=Cetraspora pellucida TaxID=1433469 RepID=A0A9N9FN67_9GLOM|nr:10081_t:CDS:2 [Cetraspora pellucida]